jgi:hypothetical protein
MENELISKELSEAEELQTTKLDKIGPQPVFVTQLLQSCANTIHSKCKQRQSLPALCFALGNHRSLPELKLACKQFLFGLWSSCGEYEPILHAYRKCLDAYKKNWHQSGSEKLIETQAQFLAAKDALISAIAQTAETQMNAYRVVRGQYLQLARTGKRGAQFTEVKAALKDLRAKHELSDKNYPQLLKDVFELFVDTHLSKQFLKKNNLVREN